MLVISFFVDWLALLYTEVSQITGGWKANTKISEAATDRKKKEAEVAALIISKAHIINAYFKDIFYSYAKRFTFGNQLALY